MTSPVPGEPLAAPVVDAQLSGIFEEPQAACSLFDPLPLVCGMALALPIGLLLYRCCMACWVVRRAALHNGGSIRLESP
ncbi:hypothetical protein D3C87_1860930 [compost metagenome]